MNVSQEINKMEATHLRNYEILHAIRSDKDMIKFVDVEIDKIKNSFKDGEPVILSPGFDVVYSTTDSLVIATILFHGCQVCNLNKRFHH